MPTELLYMVKTLGPYVNKKSVLPGQSTAQERIKDKTHKFYNNFECVKVGITNI